MLFEWDSIITKLLDSAYNILWIGFSWEAYKPDGISFSHVLDRLDFTNMDTYKKIIASNGPRMLEDLSHGSLTPSEKSLTMKEWSSHRDYQKAVSFLSTNSKILEQVGLTREDEDITQKLRINALIKPLLDEREQCRNLFLLGMRDQGPRGQNQQMTSFWPIRKLSSSEDLLRTFLNALATTQGRSILEIGDGPSDYSIGLWLGGFEIISTVESTHDAWMVSETLRTIRDLFDRQHIQSPNEERKLSHYLVLKDDLQTLGRFSEGQNGKYSGIMLSWPKGFSESQKIFLLGRCKELLSSPGYILVTNATDGPPVEAGRRSLQDLINAGGTRLGLSIMLRSQMYDIVEKEAYLISSGR